MPEITFLEKEQLSGDDKLEIFNKIGIESKITDFAILTGGAFSTTVDEEDLDKINKRVGYYWTKTKHYNGVFAVDFDGDINLENVRINNNCIRLVLQNASKLIGTRSAFLPGNNCVYFNYGEYPQKVAKKVLNAGLEQLYNLKSKELKLTGKTYTLDTGKSFIKPTILEEYEYEGKKYVRVKANSCYFREWFTLSNGGSYKNDDYAWVEVLPIKWLYDKKNDIGVSENLLLSGIVFDTLAYDGNFENTVIKKYIDEYFVKDIIPSKVEQKVEEKIVVRKKENPYNFDYSNVSEEEIIKGCVEANVAVMLHGRSGDGKSARVKELDPDAEILYLINASPDSLGGKSVLINDEMRDIPPSWFTKLKEKCERKPNKIHIVFFDEITNAPASIQGMAFNIILDKEVNGKWKLPENARIVAAGNELEESRSSYGMSEPLFNRFAHVYIETKVDDWLSWASTPQEAYESLDYKEENVPMKIHPSIYAFISYKGESVLRTEYNGKKPNADPRKWEMVSKVLYTTNKPKMIRSLVGEEITQDFLAFCDAAVITIDDVINGNYTNADINAHMWQKYNMAVHLSKVDVEHFEIVREFVKKLGPEICAVFDTLWASGNIERLEKIGEIKMSEKIGGNVK